MPSGHVAGSASGGPASAAAKPALRFSSRLALYSLTGACFAASSARSLSFSGRRDGASLPHAATTTTAPTHAIDRISSSYPLRGQT
jgi:hypothetical protein